MSQTAVPAMLERKKSFIMAAFDQLPEFEARLDHNENHTYPFMMLVNALDAYPMGICPTDMDGKTLVYCADSLVSASLAVLWQKELTTPDITRVADLLECALDGIITVETSFAS